MAKLNSLAGVLHAEYRQISNRYFKRIERFPGTAQEIGNQILDRLWAGDFYRTSLGHYNFFWMRDFGTVSQSLVALGHTTRVHYTLRWALRHYQKAGQVKLCIDKAGHVFNAPRNPGIDTLPWLLHSLQVSGYVLNSKEKVFISHELQNYVRNFLDISGDLRPGLKIAEMRDAVYYDRSAYALALIGRMAECVEQLSIPGFPFRREVYERILHEHYWNGSYFNADRSNDSFSSDSALMPFYLGVVNDEAMAVKTFDYINKKKLNSPFPLIYGENEHEFTHRFGMGKFFMPNYTGKSIWTWHATFYLHLLNRYDQPEYKHNYAKFCRLIEKHGSYPELLNSDGSWYNSPIYRSDPGMVWVALFLELPQPK